MRGPQCDRFVFCIVLAALATWIPFAIGQEQPCLIPGAVPFPIWPTEVGGPGNGSCAPGFYCPNINGSDPRTWISACPAQPNCTVLRLVGRACNPPQGRYEPTICPEKFYCPNWTEKIPCPEGHYCPAGTVEPKKCYSLSICPAESGSERYMLAILIVCLFDVVVLGLWLSWKFYSRRKHMQYNQSVKTMDKSKLQDASNTDLCEGFSRSRGRLEPFEFEFQNLSLELPGKKKKILQEVTGKIEPGTVTAILGPSGAGKTTFLNTLMGKVDSSWNRGGSLKINGDEAEMTKFKKLIGYVPQEDVMHRELNVWQNIKFSAAMRLPSTWTAEERERHADAVLHALHLTDVKYTRIGDEAERGVSGGQRKRVNIGLELAAAPLALFLDEPTSGLDATNAKEVCTTLEKIASATGITVVMVLHQPRPEIWHALDSILLLAPGGRTVYQGPQKHCQAYFEKHLGVTFAPIENPADVIMDAMAHHGSSYADTWKINGPENVLALASAALHGPVTDDTSPPERKKGKKKNANKKKASQSDTMIEMQPTKDTTRAPARIDPKLIARDSSTRGAGFFKQIWLTFERSIKQQLIGFYSLLFENGLAVIAGVIIGYAADGTYSGRWIAPYTLVSPAPFETLLPQRGMYINFAIGLAAASAGVRTFGEETVIYWREAASGHSKLSYYIGVTLAAIPRIFLASLHFSALYMVISMPFTNFGELLAVIGLVWFCVYGMSAMLSMLVPRQDAPLIAVVATLVAGVLCGYANSIPVGLQYLSYARWANEALYARETAPYAHVMEVVSSANIFDYKLDWFTQDLIIVLSMGIIYRILAFIFMILRHRDKQQ